MTRPQGMFILKVLDIYCQNFFQKGLTDSRDDQHIHENTISPHIHHLESYMLFKKIILPFL